MESGRPHASASLVEEIYSQRDRVEAERAAYRRRRIRRRILGVVAALGVAAMATVAGVELVHRHRIEGRLNDAQQHLALASADALEQASEVLDQNLSVEPAHSESLGLLAFVRVHQFAHGLIDAATVEETIEAAQQAGCPEASVAAGMLAGLQGDFDTARRAYEAELSTQAPAVANEVAWLRGITALGRPYDPGMVDEALDHLRSALERDPAWIPNRRVTAALLLRTYAADEALQVLATGRELEPNHMGLAVDEALAHAVKRETLDGAEMAAQKVLATPGVTPSDAAYARLAVGLVGAHEGDEDAVDELRAAWKALPIWDNHARDLVVDASLSTGAVDFAAKRIEEVKLGPVGDEIHEAWLGIMQGDVSSSLQRLAELPQDHARVAHLQGLGLTEQRRWDEAKRWLDYAAKRGLQRPDLTVAQARVEIHTGDPAKALATLKAVAKEHPRAHRVWTALAEARIASDADADAIEEALKRARKREAAPAEAAWMQAERLAAQAVEEPDKATDALEAYRDAIELNPHDARYKSALGRYLAELGQLEAAQELLREIADSEHVEPAALLALSRVVVEPARARGAAVGQEPEAWLTKAAQLGADPLDVELEWARLLLARNDPGSVEQARARAVKVVAARPKDISARVVLAHALVAQERYDEAKANLRQGIRGTLRTADGRLYVTLGEIERVEGKKRRAASLAFKGWRKMIKEPATGAELMAAAPFVSKLWLDLDQPRGALAVGRELTERVPWSVAAWVLRGDVQLAEDFVREGCESADKAIEAGPKDPAALALRGDCLSRVRDFKAAREHYKQAIELSEGTPAQHDYIRKLRRL